MKRLLVLTEAVVSQLSNVLEPVVILLLAVVCAVTSIQMCSVFPGCNWLHPACILHLPMFKENTEVISLLSSVTSATVNLCRGGFVICSEQWLLPDGTVL